jgi:hypothetical protein
LNALPSLLIVLWFSVAASAAGPIAASVVVAPFDATEEVKAKADLVCDGKDDQKELMESLLKAPVSPSRGAGIPNAVPVNAWRGRSSVVWLPGTYHLSDTIELPNLSDCALNAEGSYVIYEPAEGDAIHVNDSIRCRFNFGTIDSHSSGTCIKVGKVTMSVISCTGLIGYEQRGTGLTLDGTCTCKFDITDVSGFDTGILADDRGGKLDTNWIWVSYVRNCNTCIWEKGNNVDNNVWHVNVDATLPDSVALRIGGDMGNWHVIMGTYLFEGKNQALILEPGAEGNLIYMQPPVERFAATDNSGNDTNAVISTPRMRELLRLLEVTP